MQFIIARNIIANPPKEAEQLSRDVFNVFVTYYKFNIKQSNAILLVILIFFCHDYTLHMRMSIISEKKIIKTKSSSALLNRN